MKKLLLLLLLAPAVVCGQDIADDEWNELINREIVVEDVEPLPVRNDVVSGEVGRAEELMRSMPAGNLGRRVTVYRVEIFSDNPAVARERAYAAYAKFRDMCPEVGANERRDIRYDSPKYTVRVGAFLTHEEAIALCGRLRGTFNAYIRTDQMPLSTFASR